jgi:hypothetical protein
MVLSVNLELLNPLNQKKEGVYENIPLNFLQTFFFLLTAPDGSEQVPHSLLIFFWEWI